MFCPDECGHVPMGSVSLARGFRLREGLEVIGYTFAPKGRLKINDRTNLKLDINILPV